MKALVLAGGLPQIELIRQLKERNIVLPVIIGGAAVDGEFAREINAIYAADAMETVRAAQKIIGEK